ncbi:MAG TPA: hypothetical protein VGO36_05675 [Solirubrobacterales bacterium]|nr:hypothetical protein [Solirubrobacterales bacterium]
MTTTAHRERLRFPTLALTLATLAILGLGAASAQAGDLEVTRFVAPALNEDQTPSTDAGARPFEVVNDFAVNAKAQKLTGAFIPAENIKDLQFDLPPGLVGTVSGFPRCRPQDLDGPGCPAASQIGVAAINIFSFFGHQTLTQPVYNLDPPTGVVAQFGMVVVVSRVHINFRVRSGSDYGVTASLHNLATTLPIYSSRLTLWGVPGDPRHDDERGACANPGFGPECEEAYPPSVPVKPLLSNPTSCAGALLTDMSATTWQLPATTVAAPPGAAPGIEGCDQVDFAPAIEAKPTTNLADSPSGLDFHLRIPQNDADTIGRATAHLRESRVQLPSGMTVNPSSANGLGACTSSQIGFIGARRAEQRLSFLPRGTASFVVAFGGQQTAPIVGTAPAAPVLAALETLPGLAGNVALSGSPGAWKVSFIGALASSDPSELGGTVTDNSVQTLAVTGQEGTFHLSFGGSDTIELPFNANAETIEENLQALPSIGSLNAWVEQVGTSGDTRSYEVHFNGKFAGTQPALLTATSSLIGPGAGTTIAQAPNTPHPLDVVTTAAAGLPQFTPDPANCPDASKIGTVRIDTPAVIDHPLFGNVFLASQGDNPFGSLLAFYIAVNDPKSGLVLKLPARVDADPRTGQLTAVVSEAPQLPFEDLTLKLVEGAGAPLKTGIACGTQTVTTAMVPWSSPEGATMHPTDSSVIEKGAGGSPCVGSEAQAPKSVSFEAGTLDPTAGSYSPFTLKLARRDGSQQLTGIDTTLPKGLLARLAGVPYCSDAGLAAATAKSGKAEQASSSCQAASQVGTVSVGAGAGPTPFYAGGKAYLAGPYKGAPLSLAVVTPAVAGPFDLGTVVVRNALYVNSETAQVHAVSDPLPSILQGIPLDLRSVVVSLERPRFTRNPTNCNPFAVDGSVAMLSGQSASVSSHFQVGDCKLLAFKPQLALSLKGGTKRGDYPALRAVLTAKDGESGITRTAVALPHSEFLAQNHIKTICTRVQFSAGPGNGAECPSGSIYGKATATTPLLDQPLSGPVYLRSSPNLLPDLVVALHGQIDVALVGRIDSVKGGIRTTFESIPDAPVTKFVLDMQGGRKGLLQNSRSLCSSVNRATVEIDGQNGKPNDLSPQLKAQCRKPGKKGKQGKKGAKAKGGKRGR